LREKEVKGDSRRNKKKIIAVTNLKQPTTTREDYAIYTHFGGGSFRTSGELHIVQYQQNKQEVFICSD
jgi:hypothetical protein